MITRYSICGFRREGKRLCRDNRGAVAVIFALLLPVLIGFLALAVEGPLWFETARSLQNAADEAALAAATNGTSTYDKEANAVTEKYGYTDGVANIAVTANEGSTCPDLTNACYKVSVSQKLPLILSPIIGYIGNSFIGKARAQLIPAEAVAKYQVLHEFCIVALSTTTTGNGFETKGAPKADLSGCSIMSNSNMNCNSYDTGADYAGAVGTNSGCGRLTRESNIAPWSDPYRKLASSIPVDNACSPSDKSVTTWANYPNKSTNIICGDLALNGPITVTGANNVLVINGQLLMNNNSITTAPGAGLTIIFAGPDGAGSGHAMSGSGTLNFVAPKSGTWSGVAIYQNPSLKTGLDVFAAGNSPTWNITGLIYLPNSNVEFRGAVGKSANGDPCIALVAKTILIRGTGFSLAHGGCSAAGITLPNVGRGRLVA